MVGVIGGMEGEVQQGKMRESSDLCREGPLVEYGKHESGVEEHKSFKYGTLYAGGDEASTTTMIRLPLRN